MGDIRDAVIDQAHTRESLLALREADAAKTRQRWADNKQRETERGEADDG